MNGENEGILLADRISKSSEAGVIFTTAMTTDHVLKSAIHTYPIGYLVKPINPNDLKASIELAIFRKKN